MFFPKIKTSNVSSDGPLLENAENYSLIRQLRPKDNLFWSISWMVFLLIRYFLHKAHHSMVVT